MHTVYIFYLCIFETYSGRGTWRTTARARRHTATPDATPRRLSWRITHNRGGPHRHRRRYVKFTRLDARASGSQACECRLRLFRMTRAQALSARARERRCDFTMKTTDTWRVVCFMRVSGRWMATTTTGATGARLGATEREWLRERLRGEYGTAAGVWGAACAAWYATGKYAVWTEPSAARG